MRRVLYNDQLIEQLMYQDMQHPQARGVSMVLLDARLT